MANYDIRNFFNGATSSRSSIRKHLEPRTPEKQVNGKVQPSPSKPGVVSVVTLGVEAIVKSNGHTSVSGKRRKYGPVILSSSDESDAEDPVPSSISKKLMSPDSPKRARKDDGHKGNRLLPAKRAKQLIPSPAKAPTTKRPEKVAKDDVSLRPRVRKPSAKSSTLEGKQPVVLSENSSEDFLPFSPKGKEEQSKVICLDVEAHTRAVSNRKSSDKLGQARVEIPPAKRAKQSVAGPTKVTKTKRLEKPKDEISSKPRAGKSAEKLSVLERKPSILPSEKSPGHSRSKSFLANGKEEHPKTTYFDVEKPSTAVSIGGKLLTNLAQAHAEIRTPSVYETPKKKRNTDAGGDQNPSSILISPRMVTRSSEKAKAVSIVAERTPNKETKVASNVTDKPVNKRTPRKSATKQPAKSLQQQRRTPQKTGTPSFSIATSGDSLNSLTWADKYKPTLMKQIIGQQGDKSCMNKLFKWLQDWPKWHVTGEKQKRYSKGAADDGSTFKAVLLSGPPGIGKTTTAQVVCKELHMNIIELNASDARNKRSLEERVAECLASHSMDDFFSQKAGKGKVEKGSAKHALIMDEVDGMSGTEDRAGMAELIALIKKTRFPIICICNDRHSQKIRSLANYCYDLRFHRPQAPQIRSAMMSVLFKENAKLPATTVDHIIECSGHDIRQVLNHLNFLLSNGKVATSNEAERATKAARKDEAKNLFESIRKLFTANDANRQMTLNDKAELFFDDYDLVPLFVEENYLSVESAQAKSNVEQLELISRAADLMSWGDIVDRRIRNEQNWSLLNEKAMLSTVIPCELMKGRMRGQITFPTLLGRFSKQNRLRRQMQQLQFHSSGTASSSATTLVLDYAPILQQCMTQPLLKPTGAIEGVSKVLQTLDAYALTLEDRNAILEITQWPDTVDPLANLSSRVKAAFTRAYNKHERKLPYATAENAIGKKLGKNKANDINDIEIDEEESNQILEEEMTVF